MQPWPKPVFGLLTSVIFDIRNALSQLLLLHRRPAHCSPLQSILSKLQNSPSEFWITFFSPFTTVIFIHVSHQPTPLPAQLPPPQMYCSWVPFLCIIFLPANNMTDVWGGIYGLSLFSNFFSGSSSISHWMVQFTFWTWGEACPEALL